MVGDKPKNTSHKNFSHLSTPRDLRSRAPLTHCSYHLQQTSFISLKQVCVTQTTYTPTRKSNSKVDLKSVSTGSNKNTSTSIDSLLSARFFIDPSHLTSPSPFLSDRNSPEEEVNKSSSDQVQRFQKQHTN